MEVPQTISGSIPTRPRARSTPICAQPRAMPLPRAMPRRNREVVLVRKACVRGVVIDGHPMVEQLAEARGRPERLSGGWARRRLSMSGSHHALPPWLGQVFLLVPSRPSPVSSAKDRSRAEGARPNECHLCMLLVSNTTCVLLRAFSFLIIWRMWTLTVLSHMFSS